jgi:hypothetical protein
MHHFVYFDPVFAYLVLAIKKSLNIPKRSIYNVFCSSLLQFVLSGFHILLMLFVFIYVVWCSSAIFRTKHIHRYYRWILRKVWRHQTVISVNRRSDSRTRIKEQTMISTKQKSKDRETRTQLTSINNQSINLSSHLNIFLLILGPNITFDSNTVHQYRDVSDDGKVLKNQSIGQASIRSNAPLTQLFMFVTLLCTKWPRRALVIHIVSYVNVVATTESNLKYKIDVIKRFINTIIYNNFKIILSWTFQWSGA